MAAKTQLVELAAAGIGDRARVGGKAGVLGELARAGFPVPPGFVVTPSMLDRDPDVVDRAIGEAADQLGAARFAVRSSAVAEDLADASYAGLYETFLNVEPARLADAVRRCFAAADADRVHAYHAHATAGADNRPVEARRGMAVLVQPMIDADAAGVAFTVNPVTGDRNETVVTAVRGLGEQLVSGAAVGEEWTVGGEHAQDTAVRPRNGETGTDVLTAEQAREVATLARRVAERFYIPQDIEWAIAAGRLYLLQARPITALPDPVEWTPPGPGLWMRNFRLGEWLPEATTPLFADWLLPQIEAGFRDGMRSSVGTVVPFRYTTINGWYYNAIPVPSIRLFTRAVTQSRGRIIKVLFNALARVGRNPAAADRAILSDLYRQWRDEGLPAYRSLVAAGRRDIDAATPERLAQLVDQVGRAAGRHLWFLAIVGGSAWKIEACLAAFCRDHLPHVLDDHGGVHALLRGLPGTEPTLPPHAVTSADWYHPTASELTGPDSRGDHLAETVGLERHRHLSDQRIAAETACRAALRDQPKQLARYTGLLEVAQRYTVIREEQARDLTLGWPLLRRCAQLLGDQLRAAEIIADVDDVFFLHRTELDTSIALTDAVARRRAEWQRRCRLTPPLTLGDPPRLVGDAISKTVEAARGGHPAPKGAILGHPASTGRATGRIRLVRGSEDFDAFGQGEILLAKATAPAWTPLFARAAAVVTDGGTLAAHASLVAREYGIAAVVGTGDATTRLHTGQLVTVDGTTGTITPTHAETP